MKSKSITLLVGRVTKIVNKNLVNKLAFPIFCHCQDDWELGVCRGRRVLNGGGCDACIKCDSIGKHKETTTFLRWHVCRVNFARMFLFWATNILTKNAPKFSPKLLSLYSVGQKNPPKFPPNFPPNFPPKILKYSLMSFCRSAGRRLLFARHDASLLLSTGENRERSAKEEEEQASASYAPIQCTLQPGTIVYIGENQKGTAGRGREKKCHDNLRKTTRQFTTFTTICDILWQFSSLCSIDINCHKFVINVTTICDNLWHFLSRPLPPVPF